METCSRHARCNWAFNFAENEDKYGRRKLFNYELNFLFKVRTSDVDRYIEQKIPKFLRNVTVTLTEDICLN